MKTPAAMLGQLEYLRRDYRVVARHLTIRKIKNLLLNEWEYRAARTVLKSKPFYIKVEPTPSCHLHCAGCEFHGPYARTPMPKGAFLSCRDFVDLIRPLERTLINVSISLRGDSLLNPELFDMLRYCRDRNIGTSFPTHFSYVFRRGQIEQLVTSGLDHLMVSLDGTTQASYEQYRKGGKIDLVLENCRNLIEEKRRRKSAFPFIEWKYVVFDHNKHEVEEARRMSRKMGFDKFSVQVDNTSQEMENIRESKNARIPKGRPCYWLYRTMVICWDGRALACCNQDFDLGNIGTSGILSVWNGAEYRALRELFKTGVPATENGKLCMKCEQAWMAHDVNQKMSASIAPAHPWPEGAAHHSSESLPLDPDVPWFDRHQSEGDNGQRVLQVGIEPQERIVFKMLSEDSRVFMRIHEPGSSAPLEWRMAIKNANCTSRYERADRLEIANPTPVPQTLLLILYGFAGCPYRVEMVHGEAS